MDKVETIRPKPKGMIRIQVSVCVPRPDHRELSDIIDLEPLFFNVFNDTKSKKELPDGLIASVRKVLSEVVELIRNHVHEPLSQEKLNEIAASKIERVEKPSGPPSMQVFARNPETGHVIPVSKPVLLDPRGEPLNKETR